MMKRSPIREADIQCACIEWLEYNGWHVLRLNSGKALVEGRCIKLCPEGTPDTVAFKPASHAQGIVSLVFFEFKQPGKSPTTMQRIRMEELRLYGAACYVVTSLDELEQIVQQMGEKGQTPMEEHKTAEIQVGDRVAKHTMLIDGTEYYRLGTVTNVFVDHNGQEHADVLLDTGDFPQQCFLTSTLCRVSQVPTHAKQV